MDSKNLMNDLKKGRLYPSYLLYGDERFLVSYYATAIENAVFDTDGKEHADVRQYKDVFEGQSSAREIIMTANTVPFFTLRRLVLVRDSRLFATGRKDDSELMAEYLAKIPTETVIIFAESEVDRRSKMFKQITKLGVVLDCTPPTPQMLGTWVARLAKEKGKTISSPVAHQLVQTVGSDMLLLSNEMTKLVAYCGDGTEIFATDIMAISTPTLESRIFELTKAMGNGRAADALSRYHDMLATKESPHMVLTMIIRQLRIILLCKVAKERGMTVYDMAKEFGFRDFAVQEALVQAQRFTEKGLLDALADCLETDVKMKTGLITAELGVELLIIKYAE